MDWIEFVKKYKEEHPTVNGVAVHMSSLHDYFMQKANDAHMIFLSIRQEYASMHDEIEHEANDNNWDVSWHQEFAVFTTKPYMVKDVTEAFRQMRDDLYNKHCKRIG